MLLLWVQAEQRGVTLSRVAGYRTWQAVGRQVIKGARSLAVRAPVCRRLTVEEAAERARAGQRPFDTDWRPALVELATLGCVHRHNTRRLHSYLDD